MTAWMMIPMFSYGVAAGILWCGWYRKRCDRRANEARECVAKSFEWYHVNPGVSVLKTDRPIDITEAMRIAAGIGGAFGAAGHNVEVRANRVSETVHIFQWMEASAQAANDTL